jgi:hypothetical protein
MNDKNRIETYQTVNKQARLLLVLMTGLPELQWFKKNNKDLVIRPEELPTFSANIRALEALVELTDRYNDE